jgi:hypothetical protein
MSRRLPWQSEEEEKEAFEGDYMDLPAGRQVKGLHG